MYQKSNANDSVLTCILLALEDLALVDKLSNGKVDLTFGR